MKIVTGESRLLAFRSDVRTYICLIGRLVGAEPRVAGDAVGAVLHPQAAHRRVELGDSLDQPLCEGGEAPLHVRPFGAVGVEPCTVVVVVQAAEKVDYLLHATKRKADNRPSGRSRPCVRRRCCPRFRDRAVRGRSARRCSPSCPPSGRGW